MHNQFKHRSSLSELLDGPDIPKDLLIENLRELDFINRALRGHTISMNGIKKLVTDKNKIYHIVDLGCGSGDTLQGIADWAAAKDFHVKLTGVDINPDVIGYLNDYCKDYPEIRGVVGDYMEFLKSETSIDIVHFSLFCHHLNDDQLVELFTNFRLSGITGFVINDLHRHWMAYYGVKAITFILNGTALSKNDGPISVLRAFTSDELQLLLRKAQITNYSISWQWAFRYLVVGKNYL